MFHCSRCRYTEWKEKKEEEKKSPNSAYSMGSADILLLCSSKLSGRGSQLWSSDQVKPPRTRGAGLYTKVSESIVSTNGTTTARRSLLMRASSGSSHCTLTSMWLSRKTSTWKQERSKPQGNTLTQFKFNAALCPQTIRLYIHRDHKA